QIGTPLDLYDHPGNLFVAQFIGSPAMNVIEGTIKRENGAAHVVSRGGVRWPLRSAAGSEGQPGAHRPPPDDLSPTDAETSAAVPAEIAVVEPTGAETELLLQAGEAQIVLVTHGRPDVNPGDRVGLAVEPAMVHVFDQQTGQRLAS